MIGPVLYTERVVHAKFVFRPCNRTEQEKREERRREKGGGGGKEKAERAKERRRSQGGKGETEGERGMGGAIGKIQRLPAATAYNSGATGRVNLLDIALWCEVSTVVVPN